MSYCTCKSTTRYSNKFVKVKSVNGVCIHCEHYTVSAPPLITRKRNIDEDREELYDKTVLSYLTAMKELKNG